MEEKQYVCGYKHCREDSKIPASEAVLIGNRRYHKRCASDKEKIIEIRDLYIENIDDKVPIAELVSVLNQLIFKKNVDIDYMLFAIKDVIRRKVRIKSPYSLHYVAKNKKIIAAWDRVRKLEGGGNV